MLIDPIKPFEKKIWRGGGREPLSEIGNFSQFEKHDSIFGLCCQGFLGYMFHNQIQDF